MDEVIIDLQCCPMQDFDNKKYSMKAEVVSSQNIEKEIFVFMRKKPAGEEVIDTFQDVATPSQMMEFPTGEPDCSSNLFFRDSIVEKEFSTYAEAQAFCEEIKRLAAQLACDWKDIINSNGGLNQCTTETIDTEDEGTCC